MRCCHTDAFRRYFIIDYYAVASVTMMFIFAIVVTRMLRAA